MKTLIAMTLMLVACGGPLENEEELFDSTEGALTGGTRVRTSASQTKPRWSRRFAIDTTNTLYFAADVASGPGAHAVAFEVYEPSGNVWQRTEESCTGAQRVFSSMPVAGTWIQMFALTGKWQVKVFIDGSATAAGQNTFELR